MVTYKNLEKFLRKKNYFEIDKINNEKNFDKSNLFLSQKLNINFFLDFEEYVNNEFNLIFFHLFIPHTETISSDYIKKKFGNIQTTNDDEEYLLNLKFTDFIIGNILEKINKSVNKDILLILSSDHWRRSKSPTKAKPSLLLMKLKSDSSKVEMEKQNSNIHINDVILKYLEGDIDTHKEIKDVFNNSEIFNIQNTHIY